MAVTIAKTPEEIRDMPLVELAYEILKSTKEQHYFRALMTEIQNLRGMTEEEVMEVIARLYTEINIDGRFVCTGQNVWGLKRWYPVDTKTTERAPSKKFVRKSTGDAFSDDDELLDDYDEELEADDDLDTEDEDLVLGEDDDEDAIDGAEIEEEDEAEYADEDEESDEEELEELPDEDADDDED